MVFSLELLKQFSPLLKTVPVNRRACSSTFISSTFSILYELSRSQNI